MERKMRLPGTILVMTALAACAPNNPSPQNQAAIQADYARQVKLEADWAAERKRREETWTHPTPTPAIPADDGKEARRYEADQLDCKLRAQETLSRRGGIGLEALAYGNQTYDLCMQAAAARRAAY
jgi:hypothetical protein